MVIKVIKDFRLFKMSDHKYGLCKKVTENMNYLRNFFTFSSYMF